MMDGHHMMDDAFSQLQIKFFKIGKEFSRKGAKVAKKG
jgi:hypothetical protein